MKQGSAERGLSSFVVPQGGAALQFQVLGPVSVADDGQQLNLGGPKQRTVLAVLVSRLGEVVSTDQLIEAVYGDDAEPASRRTIQTYVSNLRSSGLGEQIERHAAGWSLTAPRESIDACRFEDLYQMAGEVSDRSPKQASELLREALGLWRGHPYADVDTRGVLEGEMTRLSELRLAALSARIETDLAIGRHDDVIGELEGLVVQYPYRESFRAQHMVALYRAGRQKEALRSFSDMRTLLTNELGIDPTPALRELEQRILDQDESLLVPRRPSITKRAILVADAGDPFYLARLPADERWSRLTALESEVSAVVSDWEGSRVDQAGAAFYALFEHAADAVAAALRLATKLEDEGPRLAVDFGDVELGDHGATGPPLGRVASLVASGHPGQVLLSPNAHQELVNDGLKGLRVEGLGPHVLTGIENEMPIYQLVVGDSPGNFPPLISGQMPPPIPSGPERSIPGYELRERLGEGTLGSLYRAYQPAIGREVFVEVIDPSVASEPDFIRRFEPEAQRLTLIDHPHIVPVIDYWRDPTGAYLVYPIHRGGTLDPNRCAHPERALEQIGAAIAYAHSAHLVHGSLRPDRVLLDDGGNCYVFGFPIVDQGRVPPQAASYIAPEQLAGEQATLRTDIYSLGLLAQELLTGRSVDPDSDLVPLNPAIGKAIEADPQRRHGSVAEFMAEMAPAGRSEAMAHVEARNPYKGLSTFYEADAADFYGRQDVVDEMTLVLSTQGMLTVAGPSGIGKSSVVRAGLIPAIRSDALPGSSHWIVTDMVPGSHPFRELERALARVAVDLPPELRDRILDERPDALDEIGSALAEDTALILVVDQLEELFTLSTPSVRARFIELLVRAGDDPRVRLVTTMRADFLDHPLEYSEFGEMVGRSLVTIPAPSKDELTEMIVEPARAEGVDVEPALVERLVGDVYQQPGALPLLQHTLTELFEKRTGPLQLSSYEALGGISGSISTRAEEVYQALDDRQREQARQIFVRMVTVTEEGRRTRRRAPLTELEDLGGPTAIEVFARRRLVVFDSRTGARVPTVEVAHEALLDHWARLAAWIEEAREDLILRGRLDSAISEWDAMGRSDRFLISGGRLDQHLEWTTSTDLALTPREREFLGLSADAEQTRRERRRRTRRLVTAGFGVAALVATVLAVFALLSRDSALEQARIARSRELLSAAVSALTDDPSLSKLLALEAHELAEPTIQSLAVLHEVYANDVVVDTYPWPDGGGSADLHPDGDLIVVSGGNRGGSTRLELIDLADKSVVWEVDLAEMVPGDQLSPDLAIGVPFFSSDGDTVFAGVYRLSGEELSDSERDLLGIHVWDTATGDHVERHDIGDCGGWVGDVSPTAIAVKAPYCKGGARFEFSGVNTLVDVITGEQRMLTAEGTANNDFGVALSGDGLSAAFNEFVPGEEPNSGEWHIVVEDVKSGERVFDEVWANQDDFVVQDLNDDGALLAVGQRPMHVWHVLDQRIIAALLPVDGTIAEFDESGPVLYATTRDQTLHRFDASSGAQMDKFPAVGNGRIATVDGKLMVSGSQSATIVEPLRGEFGALSTPGFAAAWSLYIANGRGIHSVATQRVMDTYVFEVESLQVTQVLPGQEGQQSALSPDGSTIVRLHTIHGEESDFPRVSPLILIDAETGDVLRELEGCSWSWPLLEQGVPREETGTCPEQDDPLPLWIDRLLWSPGGEMVAAVDHLAGIFQSRGETAVWSAETGEILWRHRADEGLVRDVGFSPDSSQVWVSYWGSDMVRVFATSTWDLIIERHLGELEGVEAMGFAGFTPDGTRMIAIGNLAAAAGAPLYWIDAHTLDVVLTVDDPHEGSPKSFDFSPDGLLLAIGSSDGVVKVWNSSTGALEHEIPLGDVEANGVSFLNDRHVLVMPQGGNLRVFTIDPDELIEITLSSLTRGFTEAECQRYGFVESCPDPIGDRELADRGSG